MTKLVCLNVAEIHAQDLVERELIVESSDIIQFVVVLQDTLVILWNHVEYNLLLNPLKLILVIQILVDHTVRNMNKKDIVFVHVYQDILV